MPTTSNSSSRWLIKIALISIIFLTSWLVIIPESYGYQPQQGDIIFQTSRSSQSLAIQQATHSIYSHMGIILFKNNQPYVFEASNRVKFTPLEAWITRGVDGKFVAKRLKKTLTNEEKQRIWSISQNYINRPYDLTFSWSDDRQYCSELVWKIYFNALGLKIGQQQKLREFNLTSPAVKAKLTERYGTAIPYNETVISPKSMFDSPLLTVVGQK
ncbi:YiiX family permuted papain-like enzyme [Pragia fontium]|uniref:YiiX family permuted papain-like enzyme n=1 Tax=Pragia fontium TaxID=82985 RepID=UPI0009E4916B|nr:YiiX family permuted papain-like enzyme [Pragia fontium]